MAESKTLNVVIVGIAGSGKVATVTYKPEGSDKTATAKAWATNKDGTPTFGEGESCTVTLEKKPGYNGGPEEVWISKPRTGGRSAGGGIKADPDKLALEKTKHEDFKKKWSIDREMEVQRQAGIMAQVLLKEAVAMEIASATAEARKCEPCNVQAYAMDLVTTLEAAHETIYATLAARENSGGGQ